MDISGFTFIKNALTLGYPIVESILSIEPLCKEIIINVGFEDSECTKDDGTFNYLQKNFSSAKFVFLKSFWDPNKVKQGLILSEQTNIALNKAQYPVCLYIQADEVLHESDREILRNDCQKLLENPKAQGLVFDYIHFYGNTDVEKYTQNVYRREVRVIKNHQGIQSHLDAQGFRNASGEKLLCLKTKSKVYHYGWAREKDKIKKKITAMNKLYHGKEAEIGDNFQYSRIWGLRKFKGTHPHVLQNWVKSNKNNFNPLDVPYRFSLEDLRLILGDTIENFFGIRIGEYQGFKLIS